MQIGNAQLNENKAKLVGVFQEIIKDDIKNSSQIFLSQVFIFYLESFGEHDSSEHKL